MFEQISQMKLIYIYIYLLFIYSFIYFIFTVKNSLKKIFRANKEESINNNNSKFNGYGNGIKIKENMFNKLYKIISRQFELYHFSNNLSYLQFSTEENALWF